MPASLTLYLPAAAQPAPGFDWRFMLLLAAPLVGLLAAFALGVDANALAPQM